MIVLKVIYEGIYQTILQLWNNKLRTFLSLLGISIGIFCIVAVKSAVNSLEDNIRGSFEKLGDDVLYISKLPWDEDPDMNYWKYMRRPNPSFEDYKSLSKKVDKAEMVTYSVFIGGKTVKFYNNTIEGAFVLAVTQDYADLFKVEFEDGRFFTNSEYELGSNKVVLGYEIAGELFENIDPIGKNIKIMGRNVEVIGVISKSGKDLINPVNFDNAVLISYEWAKNVVNVKSNHPWGSSLNVKAKVNVDLQELRGEVTGVLRANHHLSPKEKDDFSINEMSILTNLLNAFFSVLNLVGMIIGGFAIVVGMVSVANIMFVSVKERVGIIGIKKALGAKRSIILLEFLIESIFLCMVGGLLGLGLVVLVLKISTSIWEFDMYLSWGNILVGLGLSVIVGILSGIIPAIQASYMDPVVAIRQNG
jgi:putative ABC transport system permease protein